MKDFLGDFFKKNKDKSSEKIRADQLPMDTTAKLKLDKCWQISLGLAVDFITEAQLEKITTVRLFEKSGLHQTDTLGPLFSMPNLTKLTLTGSYRQPVDFNLLLRLENLRDLRIAGRMVTRWDTLEGLDYLENLDISHVDLKTDQLKCINDFPNLKKLSVNGTGLRSMKIFQNNNNIERLICSYSKGIKNMTKLNSLFMLLKDQVDITGCPNLRYLRISIPKKMTNTDNLASVTSLEKLQLINLSKPMNMVALSHLTNLKELHLDPFLDLESLSEPMETVLRLSVLSKHRSHFEAQQSLLSSLFPNASVVPYESFIRFMDL